VTSFWPKGRLMSTARAVAFKVVMALVALIVSFAAAEVLLRTLHPCPRYGYELVSAQRVLFEHDPVLGWRGRPGIHATLAGESFRVSATHNASGHRSAALPSFPGKTNIVAIGDSHSWGWGVSDDEVFADQMMRMDSTLNVYNISAPGYGTDQEFLALREFLRKQPCHSPGLVILLFSANDFEDVGDSMRFAFPKPRFSLRGGRLELRNVPVPDLGRHAENPKTRLVQYPRRRRNLFHTYNLIEWSVKNIPTFKHKAEMRKVNWAKLRIGERNVQVVTTLLCAAKHLCSGVGSDFLVVFLLTGEDWRYEIVRDELKRAGIRFIHHKRRRFPFRNQLWLDGHLNGKGHRQLAKQLVSYVSETGN
jgi:lysophospholipase L1-like esterase